MKSNYVIVVVAATVRVVGSSVMCNNVSGVMSIVKVWKISREREREREQR